MKKITLLTSLFLSSLFVLGQANLYGTLPSGGSSNLGAIYKTDSNGQNLNIIHEFALDDGTYRSITQEMIEITGKMYGLGMSKTDNLEIYSYELSTQKFKVEVKNVADSMGQTPGSSFLKSANGKYYFITSKGGANNQGTLLEYIPSTNILTKKHDFGAVGSLTNYPTGDIVEGQSGKFYGTCYNGGATGKGCVYKVNINNNTSSVVHSFTTASAGRPGIGMIKANNGKFYGTTTYGGANNKGALYSFDPSNNQYDSLKAFDNSTQHTGNNKLFQASNGHIYSLNGRGSYGGLFEYNIASNQFTKLVSFTDRMNGSRSIISGITEPSNGNLMFALQRGSKIGNNNPYDGSVVEYNLSNNQVAEIAIFNGANAGLQPLGTLAKASNGHYYIHTSSGGKGGSGTLVELDYTNKSVKSIYDFASSANGVSPAKKLIASTNGKLYGIANKGGLGAGVFYSIDPTNNDAFKMEIDVPLGVGHNFSHGFALAPNGSFYACAGQGGGGAGYDRGTAIKYNPTSNSIKKVGDFYLSFGGYGASSALTIGQDNHVYGVANTGGDDSKGLVFRINTQLDTLENAKSFSALGPQRARGNLTALSNGNFIGATSEGGDNSRGTVYEYVPAEDSFYTHVHLHDSIGYGTTSGFVKAENGKFYSFFHGNNSHPVYSGGTLVEFDYATKSLIVKNGRKVYYGSRWYGPVQEDFISLSGNKLIGIVPGTSNSQPSKLAIYDIDQDTLEVLHDFVTRSSGLTKATKPLPISITSIQDETRLTLYPNPASQKVKIDIAPNQILEVRVTNLMGQDVNVLSEANVLQIEGLKPGIYLVSVVDIHQQKQTLKLLVK